MRGETFTAFKLFSTFLATVFEISLSLAKVVSEIAFVSMQQRRYVHTRVTRIFLVYSRYITSFYLLILHNYVSIGFNCSYFLNYIEKYQLYYLVFYININFVFPLSVIECRWFSLIDCAKKQ